MNPSLNKGRHVGLTISLLGHSALLAVVIGSAFSTQLATPTVIPISVVTREEAEALEPQFSLIEQGAGPSEMNTNGRWSHASPQGEYANTQAVAKMKQPPGADSGVPSTELQSSTESRSEYGIERSLSNTAAAAGGISVNFREDKRDELTGVKITRRTDWQANPVEDNTLTYSAPGSATRLTMRAASSAGFVGDDFASGFNLTNAETSMSFGRSANVWNGNTAKSQKIDWTLVNRKNFGATAFGYQNEIGYNFRPFGQTKKEFATPGTNTMKAGGEVRLGAFAMGMAHSTISKLEYTALPFSTTDEEAETTLNEASLTLNLFQFLPTQVTSGAAGKLIPTVWMTASDRQSPGSDQASTISTSLGASWNWNYGHANLGYWNYSSDGSGDIETAWSGHGIDANIGAFYGAFGVDLSASYGHSEDIAPSWQAAGALYRSALSVTYTPDRLPGVWASMSGGNYNHESLSYGSTSSEIYGISNNGEYLSLAAGLDVTNWFWTPDHSSKDEHQSVKLLYRYTDAVYVESTTGMTGDTHSLVAMTVQRKF